MAGDAQYGYNSLLLHGDSTFVDSGPLNKTVTVTNAVISATQSKFGGSSMYFDGTGDYLTLDGSSDFSFGTGDFTIEMWVWLNSASATYTLLDFRTTGANGAFPTLYTASSELVYYFSSAVKINAAHGITSGTWAHVALCRSGSSTKLFVNGSQIGSTLSDSTSLSVGASRPSVGTSGNSLNTSNLTGYIDDLRITKGYARYPSAFSYPTAAFLDYAGQVSGLVRDSTNALCARTVRAYDRSTGALVASTTSNGTTGAYTLNCSTVNEVSVIALDDVAGTTENDLILRTTPA